jgi:hypothetical protein
MGAAGVAGGRAGSPGLQARNLPGKPAQTVVNPAIHDTSVLVVKFRDDLRVRVRNGLVTDEGTGHLASARGVLLRLVGASWQPSHRLTEARLDQLRANAQNNSGRAVADLNTQFNVKLPPGFSAGEICDALNALEIVELATPMLKPMPLPQPPNFEPMQGYLTTPSDGINAQAVWNLPGGTGAGIKVADIEYSWNLTHQDLSPTTLLGPQPVDPFNDTNHGTAVLGEIGSLRNGWGTTGIAYESTMYVVAANTSFSNDVGAAITQALGTLGPGDVILIEQQTTGPNYTGQPPGTQFGLVPVEWYSNYYNSIVMAVGNGVIVVEAASNGSQNLDDAIYGGWFAPAHDSGAIIVGAGAAPAANGGSNADRSRLGFSNYGSTVDLQGWGEAVWTTGYGDPDAYNAEGPNLFYTRSFGGTSGASPIVAGACILLQSTYFAETGVKLSPTQVRDTLRATGSSQQNGTFPATQNIGPRPDVLAALHTLGGGGCSSGQNLTLHNTGQGTLDVSSVSKPSWVQLSPPPPYQIAGGQNKQVCATVDCAACSGSGLDGTLTINSNDPDEPSVNVSVHVDCPLCDGVTCSRIDQCTDSVCNPVTGACEPAPDPASTPCERDGDLCTIDHCNGSGSCVTFDTVDCPGPTGPCDGGTTCNPSTGACDPNPDPSLSTPCERDGNLCTIDHCNGSGSCVTFDTVDCPGPTGPCDGGTTCNPSTGACDPNPDPSPSTPCERDGNLCTIDHCDGNGSCVTFDNVVCQPANPPCEGGEVCNPVTGTCDPQPDAPNGTPCDLDGLFCTADTCSNGICSVHAGNPCQADACCSEECTECLPAAQPQRAGLLFVASKDGNSVSLFDGVTGDRLSPFVENGTGGLHYANGIAVSPHNGDILVASVNTATIKEFRATLDACETTYVGDFASGVVASGIAFGPDGDLYATDWDNDRVLRFDGINGAPDVTFEATGCGLDGPSGLVFTPCGKLLVASEHTGVVVAFDIDTDTTCSVVATGCGLDVPVGMALLPNGHLLVASSGNDTIVEFDLSRENLGDRCLRNFVAPGACGLDGPGGITIGPNGNVFVASMNTDSVLEFSGVDGTPAVPCQFATGCPMNGPTYLAFGVSCASDSDCDNRNACDGSEQCLAGSCNRGYVECVVDCNENGLSDWGDVRSFVSCLHAQGPDARSLNVACTCADLDRDGFVDLRDVARLQTDLCLNGR